MPAGATASIIAVADGAPIDRAPSVTVGLGLALAPAPAPGSSVSGDGSTSSRGSTGPITSLRGVALLTGLGDLSASRLQATLRAHPGLVDRLLSDPPAATETATAWRLMPSSGRAALARLAPRLVGSLEGVPYIVRDRANRAELDKSIDAIRSRLAAGVGRGVSAELSTRLHMLEQVSKALRPTDSLPRELLALDTSGQGKAVISIGDVSTADYVSFFVPGMYYGVDARIVPWTATAAEIAVAQRNHLVATGRSDQSAAVISWIGYETPTLVDVASMTDARAGGKALAAALRGLTATRSGTPPFVTLLGHSYGATAAMLAVGDDGGVSVDALAVVGSPGSPASTASQLRVRNGNVWVGAAPWDPIAQSGVFGSQPASSSFGAHRLGVSGGWDPLTGQALTGAVSHNDYFSVDSETIRNFALIGLDDDDQVLGPGSTVLASKG